MLNFNLSLTELNPDYAVKQALAKPVLDYVWNSDEFKQAVLNNSYTATSGSLWWKRSFTVKGFTTTDQSNEQIYTKLMSVQDIHINQDIVACANSKVVGYEYDGDPTTYVCKGWDEALDVAGVCDNASHEYCHQLGYVHSSASDTESVPYKIGYIVEALARKYLAQQASAAGSPLPSNPVL